jgi:hypothetical protein
MNIQLIVTVDTTAIQAPGGALILEANYFRSVPDETERVENVPASVRATLDETFTGTLTLEDAATNQVVAAVLDVTGSALFTTVLTATDGTAALTLDEAALSALAANAQTVPTDTVIPNVLRIVRLVPTGEARVDFARSGIAVIPITDLAALDAIGLTALLHNGGTRIASLEVTGQELDALRALAWIPAQVGIDGVFTASFVRQTTLGWMWWLTGARQIVGFVPDNLVDAERTRLVIPLPALSSPPPGAAPAPEGEGGPGRIVPADVSESEVVNNPDIFTEDPGTFCRPFSNPERVVSEKSFSVIARITQPDIGPLGSVRTKTLSILSLEAITNTEAPTRGFLARVFSGASGARATIASFAALNTAVIPSRHNLASRYEDFIHHLPSGRTEMDANHPMQWEDDIAQYQAATVALGHILEYRVRWRSNGYSLGTVASTLTLAPRQTRRIQKIEWERRERARRTETTQLFDQENDSVIRERDYNDTVAANLSEWARGGSSSSTSAIAGGIGFFAAGILGGIGGGASSAHSTSHQSGGRDTTASEQQRLRDSIRRHGDALRKLESTVVSEVTQEETVTGTTEVIRNANYAHSLTVIYYQILRHLKVTTEFAGVRECIFVPFAVKPFDVHRAYRWRESLQLSMRTPRYSRGLRYLKDVATNFSTSDIAPGTRASQALTYVRGSIYVSLGVERPKNTAEGLFDAVQWQVAQPLLDTPALGIFSWLASLSEAARDRAFQAEHAPGMAARWANRLLLRVGNRTLAADFTLASRYQFNRSQRIDFSIPASELVGLSRESIQQLTVVSQLGLPPGSVANLTRLSFTYNTDRFEHSVEGRSNTNDLVTPVNANPDNASVALPLDAWERVNERLEITRAVEQLIEHLNEHVEYYTKAILWLMDRDRLLMLLDGFYIPNTNQVSIASVVDREPIGIIGNSLVYRVGAASFIGYGKVTTPQALYNVYAESEPVTDPVLISLPTDGLYAQTIMDECAALEEHYGNTDWVLNDQEPDLGVIDPSLLQSRRTDTGPVVTPTPFPTSIINLQNAPEAPAPSGLAGVLNAVTNPNAFRDMAGLAGTQANAMAAFNAAANLATNFGNQAAALELAKLAKASEATRTADQKIASIKGAVDKGLAKPDDAAQAAKDVLSAMNPDSPKAEAPHENAAINSAINAAKSVPGSTIEATTGEGGVKVALGGEKTASLEQPLERVCGFFGPNDVQVTEDELRDSIRTNALAERDNWWNGNAVIREGANSQFGHLAGYWMASKSRIRPTSLEQLRTNAPLLTDADYGRLLTAGSTGAQITAAAVAARTSLLQGVPDADGPADLNNLIEQSLRSSRLSKFDVVPGGPWSAVFVSACVRASAIQFGLETFSGGAHIGRDELLTVSSAHRIYVLAAYRARFGPNPRQATYHAFRTDEVVPKVGDIIIQDRRDGIGINDVLDFDDIPTELTDDFPLHGDIVVDVPDGQNHVVTVGANLGNSARFRHYPLDAATRHLVVDRTQLYVQEDDTAGVANLPSTNNAAGLNDLSTGRIFAVLVPVAVCAVIPGQPYHGGVIA